MKFLISGRTSTGKDTLREILENKHHWSFVKSMTTRPKRTEFEDTHIFLNEKESSEIDQSQKAAWTNINGYEYFSTKEQIYDADAYIVDPIGIEMVLKNMPEEYFEVIYLEPSDKNTQKEMALNRTTDKNKESDIYESRYEDENTQFSEFEEKIKNNSFNYTNCGCIRTFTNNYDPKELEEFADSIERIKHFHRNAVAVIDDAINQKIINANNGNPIVTLDNKDAEISKDLLASYFSQNPNAIFGDFMLHWLSLENVNLQDYITARDIELNDFLTNVSPAVEKLTTPDINNPNHKNRVDKANQELNNLESQYKTNNLKEKVKQ